MKIIYKNWFIHNVIGHPVMYFVGLLNTRLAMKIHDSTLPKGEE